VGVVDTGRGVDLEVVGPELVDLVLLDVGAPFARPTVSPTTFPARELVAVAVHADEEYIEVGQEVSKLEPPAAVLGDVIDDEVVPGRGQGGNTAVKAVERTSV